MAIRRRCPYSRFRISKLTLKDNSNIIIYQSAQLGSFVASLKENLDSKMSFETSFGVYISGNVPSGGGFSLVFHSGSSQNQSTNYAPGYDNLNAAFAIRFDISNNWIYFNPPSGRTGNSNAYTGRYDFVFVSNSQMKFKLTYYAPTSTWQLLIGSVVIFSNTFNLGSLYYNYEPTWLAFIGYTPTQLISPNVKIFISEWEFYTANPVSLYCGLSWTQIANLNQTGPNTIGQWTKDNSVGAYVPNDYWGDRCFSAFFASPVAYQFLRGEIVMKHGLSMDGIRNYMGIDDRYVDGASVTVGVNPRNHVWTYIPVSIYASCNQAKPSFVGSSFFCVDGQTAWDVSGPLFGGKYFYYAFNQVINQTVEVRMCADQDRDDEFPMVVSVRLWVASPITGVCRCSTSPCQCTAY
jgi:hypothetical protein